MQRLHRGHGRKDSPWQTFMLGSVAEGQTHGQIVSGLEKRLQRRREQLEPRRGPLEPRQANLGPGRRLGDLERQEGRHRLSLIHI